MARYKLPTTVVLLHVCRLSAEGNGPTDLLHHANNIGDQLLSARGGGVRAPRTVATGTATKTYRGNNFVDPSEYNDAEVVGLTPARGHAAAGGDGDGDGDGNRVHGRNLQRTKAERRTELVNDKSAKGIARKKQRRGFRTNVENDAYDELGDRTQSNLEPVPIDIGSDNVDSTNNTTASARANATMSSTSSLPPGTLNSTPGVNLDPTLGQDPELDQFRTDHVFDPHYNGGDVIEIEKEMREGGVAFEYDESSPSPMNKYDFEVDFGSYSVDYSGSFSTDFRRSCKSSKGSGKGKGKGKGYGKGRCKSSKSSGKGGSGKGASGKSRGKGRSGKGGIVHEYDYEQVNEENQGAKSANSDRTALLEDPQRQRNRMLWKNEKRSLRGEGEADEDRMAALREEEDPSLQGVAAIIAAHQQREDRQRQKKLQRRRNRTPEEKARDRALDSSARRR